MSLGDEVIPEGFPMARDTPLGKKTHHVERSLMVRSTFWLFFFSLAAVGIPGFSFHFSKCQFSFALLSDNALEPIGLFVPLTYFGVPDAGRDGEWLGSRQMPIRHQLLTRGNGVYPVQ